MPELPEVETIARGLQREVAGQQIVSVTLGKTDFMDNPEAIERELAGRSILRVERYGKFMLLRLSVSEGEVQRRRSSAAGASGHDWIADTRAGQRASCRSILTWSCCWAMGANCATSIRGVLDAWPIWRATPWRRNCSGLERTRWRRTWRNSRGGFIARRGSRRCCWIRA